MRRVEEKNVKNFNLEEATKAQSGVEKYLYSFFNLDDRWGGLLTARSGCFTPGKEIRYPFYRRLSRPQGQSGLVRKISRHRNSIPGPSSS